MHLLLLEAKAQTPLSSIALPLSTVRRANRLAQVHCFSLKLAMEQVLVANRQIHILYSLEVV